MIADVVVVREMARAAAASIWTIDTTPAMGVDVRQIIAFSSRTPPTERSSPCVPEMCRNFRGTEDEALTTAIYRKLSAIGLTMAQGCAV
jgi:hypothetical protein